MKYNFDQINDRRGGNSVKWEVAEQELPMWVADMDFQTAPAVREAIEKRAATGIFGYSMVTDEWKTAVAGWWSRRYGYRMQKEWILFCTGVIPAVSCAVRRLTNPGDQVLVLTPVYDIFYNSIENHGRHILECPLVYNDQTYSIDFSELEAKLSEPLTRLMILCNPHNPTGNLWSREELMHIGELCAKYHVTVLSDEIHCDLTAPGTAYLPFASVSETCAAISVTCISPSKAFNLAGIQASALVISDESLRQVMNRGINADEIAEPNAFAMDAVTAAYQEGEDWLDELRIYLHENRIFAENFIRKEIPGLTVVPSQATYLLWIDASDVTENAAELCRHIRQTTGLYLSEGGKYRGNGHTFLRLNAACPRALLEDGLARLKKGIPV